MKKKISILFLTLGMSLFAYTETLEPMRIDVEIEKNDDMKLKIDCSYAKPKFYQQVNINDFMESICKSKTQGTSLEITYGDFYKDVKDFNDNHNFKWSRNTGITYINNHLDYESLGKLKEQTLFYHLDLYHDNPLAGENKIVMEIPIISLTNTTVNLDYVYSPVNGYNNIDVHEEYVIKNYKYDAVANKIEFFEIDKPFKDNSLRTFINTYNIDNETECINGNIWVKKYGSKSGGNCEWLEKTKNKKGD